MRKSVVIRNEDEQDWYYSRGIGKAVVSIQIV